MIVAGSANPLLLASAAGGYNLTNSLRFRESASAYLSRTPASAGNRKTWTWSAWFKNAGNTNNAFFSTSNNYDSLRYVGGYNGDGTLNLSTDTNLVTLTTTAAYRDVSAWYHIVLAVDTTQATAANRVKIYINGVQQTLTGTYPTLNSDLGQFNNTVAHAIGRRESLSNLYFDGYMTEINFINAQQLTPSDFGSTSATTGVWQPIEYAGTYGTNGFYLPFTDNSALTTSSNVGLGKDFSGNGNYWATNNISITAGVTYDSMTDVPTLTSATASNFAVMNPIDSASAIKPEYANLRLRNASSTHSITRGTVGVTSGKYYWEIKVSSAMSNFYSGIATNQTDISTTTTVGADAYSWAYVGSNGEKRYNGSSSAYGSALVNGDVLGCALDLDNGKIYWSVNGTFQASGDPAAGTNPAFTGVTGTCFPAGGTYNMTIDYNFGQRPFAYTPPTGFVALNTFNLPTPTIGATASTQANKYFDATTYTGNGSTQSITNSGSMQPDWVWIKGRSDTWGHALYDVIRGVDKRLSTNSTAAESTTATGLTSFNSNGFSLSTNGDVNNSADTYVAWQWDAGGTGVTNTAGSITSTVSANTTAGFSVVTYTAPSSGAFTVGHGLGVAPAMIITKSRSNSGYVWGTYHQSLGNTKRIDLNSTAAAVTSTNGAWNNTSPTSSVFTVGLDWAGSGITYVAYCFSEVAGYSKFGSYTGNTLDDGPFIYTGFKPAYVMIKGNLDGYSWVINDDARNPSNAVSLTLRANTSAAETSEAPGIDFLSNGFKIRNQAGNYNNGGTDYIFMAFAENPFKYSNAR
jgi:hypothetical protein